MVGCRQDQAMIGQRRVRLWTFRSKLWPSWRGLGRDMAGRCVSVRTLVAALLILLATVSGSTGPSSREIWGASRIPAQFSEEERVAIKEALKGEPPLPWAQTWVPQFPVIPGLSIPFPWQRDRPLLRLEFHLPQSGLARSVFQHTSRHTVHGSGTPLSSVSPCLAWRLQLVSAGHTPHPPYPCLPQTSGL